MYSLVGVTTDMRKLESDEDVRRIAIAAACIILIALITILATLVTVRLLRKRRRAQKKFLTMLHDNSEPQYCKNITSKEYKGTSKVSEHECQILAGSAPCSEQILLKVQPEPVAQEHDYDHIQPQGASLKVTVAESNPNKRCTAPVPENRKISTKSHNSSQSDVVTANCNGRKVVGTHQNTQDNEITGPACTIASHVHSAVTRSKVSTVEPTERASTHDYEIDDWSVPAGISERRANITAPWSAHSSSNSTITASKFHGQAATKQGMHSTSTGKMTSGLLTSTDDYVVEDWMTANCPQGIDTPKSSDVIALPPGTSSKVERVASTLRTKMEGDAKTSTCSFQGKVNPITPKSVRSRGKLGAVTSAQYESIRDYEIDSRTIADSSFNRQANANGSSKVGTVASTLHANIHDHKVDNNKTHQAGTDIQKSGAAHSPSCIGRVASALTKSCESLDRHVYSTIPENQIGAQETNSFTKSVETMLRELEEECGVANVVPVEKNEAYGTNLPMCRKNSHVTAASVAGSIAKGRTYSSHRDHRIESQEYDYILV